jgi:hypothetical protein
MGESGGLEREEAGVGGEEPREHHQNDLVLVPEISGDNTTIFW